MSIYINNWLLRTYCAHCLQTCALSTRLNNNRSIRFVSKPPLMDFVHLQGGGRRRRERERKKKGRGVVNKSLVIGLWDQQWLVSVIAIQRAYDRGSFFFFFRGRKVKAISAKRNCSWKKDDQQRGHGQMARPGELTADERFFFSFLFNKIFYISSPRIFV